MDKHILDRFFSLACALSPENLCCDGELPRAEVRRKYNRLTKEWKALETKLGRKVSESEVWAAYERRNAV